MYSTVGTVRYRHVSRYVCVYKTMEGFPFPFLLNSTRIYD